MASPKRSIATLRHRGVYIAYEKAAQPEKLKPINRLARRAIKSGRKHSEKQSMEKSAAGTHD